MKKKLLIPVILILVTLPTLIPLFNSRFFYTQDYIFIARLNQMYTALLDGQFPVRWAPDLRYGEPIFNFYAPLPYYIGAVIHLLGFDFIWTAKILFMLSTILSAMAMYLLVNSLFDHRAGFLAAVLYTYAPYRAVDMYVRGSLSETWAFIFFPLIFYSSKLLTGKLSSKNLSLLSLTLAGLFLTHNVTTLMFLPFLLLWWVYLILKSKQRRVIVYLLLGLILGFGLAAFFLLPSFFERNFIQTQYLTAGYFNFRIHFVAVSQFFTLFWGYGSSVWGPKDGLSFQIGLVNWILFVASILSIIHIKDKKMRGLLCVLCLSFMLSIFLQHTKSDFIWEAIPLMAFIQFPWRFLSFSVFIISITGGAISLYLRNKFLPIYFTVIIAAVALTLGYFRPKEYANDDFFDKFLNKEKMHQGIDLTKDYLPIWVTAIEGDRFDTPRTLDGKILVTGLKKNSTQYNFNAEVPVNSLLEVPITYFPGWKIQVDNQLISQSFPSSRGLISFELPQGKSQVKIELTDTPIRRAGNIISAFSIFLVSLLLIYQERRKLKWVK